MFVNVAINIPADKVFSYSVPARLEPAAAIGKRVLVPFGRKRLSGYVVSLADESSQEGIKDILDVLDAEPLFNEADLSFYQWMSEYYLYPIGKTVHELTPGGIGVVSELWITGNLPGNGDLPQSHRSSVPGPEAGRSCDSQYARPNGKGAGECPDESGIDVNNDGRKLSPLHRKIVDAVHREPKGLSMARLKRVLGRENLEYHVQSLFRMGLINLDERLRRPGVSLKKEKIVVYDDSGGATEKLTEKQADLAAYLKDAGSVSMTVLRREFKNASPLVTALGKKGMVRVSEQVVYRSSNHLLHAEEEVPVVPNSDQEAALAEIIKGIESGEYSPYLLHGVTGSGKTEVYLRAVERVLKMGGGVIYLVPEISLTPQLIRRISSRFAAYPIAVMHSDISPSLRYDQWRQIQSGAIKFVIGARSALFAPVRHLKLIIVDEEHDNSYKQEERLCYHARDLALVKARLQSATAVLGSATPAVQTFFNAAKGKYRYLALSRRVEDRPLPDVRVVDMKSEQDEYGEVPILSRSLKESIGRTLAARKQALIFLNRRGFNTYLFCRDCGHVFLCPNCELALTYHAGQSVLKCHYCDFEEAEPSLCPSCRCRRISRYGIGTERLEDELKRCFPSARIDRMDSDTMSRKGSYERIMSSLQTGRIDILVGTQMIAKGHDYPGITLVGVVGADTGLNIPDFRAAERTFQVLTQVSGRGGRGDAQGLVIIQTFHPDHYAIQRAKHHHYEGFYADELPLRRALFYPPFSRIINLQISCLRKDHGKKGAERIGRLARNLLETENLPGRIDVIGPAEAPIPRMKGRYRWQILLKGTNPWSLKILARKILADASHRGLEIKADVDPVGFM